MKKFVCFLIVIISLPVYAQYTVILRCGHIINPWNPQHPSEWRMDGKLYADIFNSDGNLVSPSYDYYYLWERNYCDGDGFKLWDETYGITNYVIPDGHNSIPSACDPSVPTGAG